MAVFLAEESFGFEGGTRLVITLRYDSIHNQHTFGRVRLSVGQIEDEGLESLPLAMGSWHQVGPFPAGSGEVFRQAFGPESDATLDRSRKFGSENLVWKSTPQFLDETLNVLPVDLVFVMDTSGSINDEAQALCDNIEAIITDLQNRGITVTPTLLGITEDPTHNPFVSNPAPGSDDGVPAAFSCLTDNVLRLFGSDVPGRMNVLNDQEDWGDATAIVAEKFDWSPDAIRLIVPISDEDPQVGDGCDDSGSDRDSIENAVSAARANNVIVSPIVAELVDGTPATIECIKELARRLATATGGSVFKSSDPGSDLAGGIERIIEEICTAPPICP